MTVGPGAAARPYSPAALFPGNTRITGVTAATLVS
jgi:hypothetical protein